ncbi:MAG: hypothetical protein A2076_09260 [Geobacteraceae bacterium GWC2_53_11]|nr:MAG: hypothetical protein A2076_09260 [Geobacteraceae bacterium GWC2_53_11]
MTNVLGWVWFVGSLSNIKHGYAFLTAVAFIAGTFSSPRAYQSKYKNAVAVIYFFGILGIIPDIYGDYGIINGPDYSAIAIRTVEIFVLGALAREAIITKKTNKV